MVLVGELCKYISVGFMSIATLLSLYMCCAICYVRRLSAFLVVIIHQGIQIEVEVFALVLG